MAKARRQRHRRPRSRWAAALVGAALVATLGAVLAVAAGAAPSTKRYTATVTPTTASAGATVVLRLTLTNSATSAQAMGSANVTVPAGVVVTALGTPTTTAGKVWTASLVDGVILLRNPGPNSVNRLAAGQAVSVDVTAKMPATTGTIAFATAVKQSNDFSGSGNDFTRTGSDPTVAVGPGAPATIGLTPATATVAAGTAQGYVVTAYDGNGNATGDVTASSTLTIAPDGSCTSSTCMATTAGTHTVTATRSGLSTTATLQVVAAAASRLAFVTQPSATVVGAAITPAVRVAVRDAYGNLATATANVSLALRPNASGAVLGGTTSVAPVSGIATFSNLTVSVSGSRYALVASSGALPPATSAEFDVPIVLQSCAGSTGCTGTTGDTPSADEPTVATVFVPAGGKDGILLIGTDPSAADPSFCGGTPCVGSIVTVLPPGSDDARMAVRVILTYDKAITGGTGVTGHPVYVDFGGGPQLVPDCRANGRISLPCVDRRYRTGVGDLVIETLIPFSIDPRIGLG